MYTKKGFTLVELIVVVTILAILSAIGFVSYSSYLIGSRDTTRISHLTSTQKAMHLYVTKNKLPYPDDKITIESNGKIIAYQGYLGKNVLETLEFTKDMKDPQEDAYYGYYLTSSRKEIQLLGFLEDAGNLPSSQTALHNVKSVNAASDYSEKHPILVGRKLGILTDQNNLPIHEDTNMQASGSLDIATTSTTYTAHLTNEMKATGDNSVLSSLKDTEEVAGKWCTADGSSINCNVVADTGGSGGGFTLPDDLTEIFDPGSDFVDNWDNNSCTPASMTVVDVAPGTDVIPENLVANTIYKLQTGTYITSTQINYEDCTAIIGTGDSNLFSSAQIGTTTGRMLNIYDDENTVTHGINIDGEYNGISGTHTKNERGIYLANGSNNTLSNVKVFNSNGDGIYVYKLTVNTDYNILNNVTSYNNGNKGIYLYSTSYNDINNFRSYNNVGYGFYVFNTSTKNRFNNIHVYNNGSYGVYSSGADYNTYNNIAAYNNANHGVYMNSSDNNFLSNVVTYNNTSNGFRLNASNNNLVNNITSYNNISYGLYNSATSTNTYYGTMKSFGNGSSDSITGLTAGSSGPIGLVDGGSIDGTGVFAAGFTIQPSVSGWNYVTKSQQTGLTFTGNETYTYGSSISKQIRPAKYNVTTLELYGVDSTDYSTSKSIGEW